MYSRKILVGICLIAFAQPALADKVTPSERVETRLRIRDVADGQAQVIGHILPGQALALRATIPNWYEVELPNGQRGFVNKAWATLVPDSLVAPIRSSEIRIGSWNVRKLGHGPNKNFSLVAQVIDTHFDVVAIVEVMQKGGGHPGYDSLMAQLGPGWLGVVTNAPRPETSSGSAEFYAILFRATHARLCAGWSGLRFHVDNSGGAGASGPDRFSREPAFACFVAIRADHSSGFDFMLAAYHAVWADGDIGDIQSEASHLGEVFSAMAAAQPGERDLIVAGDFNLVASDLQSIIPQVVRTIGTGSTLNGSGQVTSNLYDHIIANELAATAEMIAPDEVLDVRSVASSNQLFFQTVSDHLPAVARFRVAADDD
jgi:endonuclease/exonuclease/phosphatase family protein